MPYFSGVRHCSQRIQRAGLNPEPREGRCGHEAQRRLASGAQRVLHAEQHGAEWIGGGGAASHRNRHGARLLRRFRGGKSAETGTCDRNRVVALAFISKILTCALNVYFILYTNVLFDDV